MISSRPAKMPLADEVAELERAFQQATQHGKVLVEFDTPVSLDVPCLANIGHMNHIHKAWEAGGSPSVTFIHPPRLLVIILQTLGVRYSAL